MFWTFEGTGGYGCNPKYIAEALIKRKENWELVWLLDDLSYKFPKEIEKVKNTLMNRAYHLATARVWIGNSRTQFGTKKRKNQIYIQTWHGTVCIKPIGKYRGDHLPLIAQIVSEADSRLIDYVLSGSDWCDIHYPRGLLYSGHIVRTGTPRCDILFKRNEKNYQKVRKRYHIPNDAKIVLYAPTFRGGGQNKNRVVTMPNQTIQFDTLIKSFEKRFGGNWYVLLRLHPQLAHIERNTLNLCSRIIDVTVEPDMNEIVVGIDAFISDYSSAIFEAALLGIPCFIYVDDKEEYISERGNLFFDFSELPFPVADSNEKMNKNIICFDQNEYELKTKQFIEENGIKEDGRASERVVNMIRKLVNK